MKVEEILGLLALLGAVFIIGLLMNLEILNMIILLFVGGLLFLVIYTKNSYAIFGGIALIFALLIYSLFSSDAKVSFVLSEKYITSIILIMIILFGFAIAYFSIMKK